MSARGRPLRTRAERLGGAASSQLHITAIMHTQRPLPRLHRLHLQRHPLPQRLTSVCSGTPVLQATGAHRPSTRRRCRRRRCRRRPRRAPRPGRRRPRRRRRSRRGLARGSIRVGQGRVGARGRAAHPTTCPPCADASATREQPARAERADFSPKATPAPPRGLHMLSRQPAWSAACSSGGLGKRRTAGALGVGVRHQVAVAVMAAVVAMVRPHALVAPVDLPRQLARLPCSAWRARASALRPGVRRRAVRWPPAPGPRARPAHTDRMPQRELAHSTAPAAPAWGAPALMRPRHTGIHAHRGASSSLASLHMRSTAATYTLAQISAARAHAPLLAGAHLLGAAPGLPGPTLALPCPGHIPRPHPARAFWRMPGCVAPRSRPRE